MKVLKHENQYGCNNHSCKKFTSATSTVGNVRMLPEVRLKQITISGLSTLQTEHIKKVEKLAGKADPVSDGKILKSIRTFHKEADGDGV